MNSFLEDVLVEVAHRGLAVVDEVETDAKDRHVLVAALSAHADIVLTDNVRRFPRGDGQHGLELLAAGDLLAHLVELRPRPDARRSPQDDAVPVEVRGAHL